MANVSLRSLTIHCTDLAKTREFYEAIGLELHPDLGWEGIKRYFTRLEGDLSFNIHLVESVTNFSNGLEFQVDNLEEVLEKLEVLQATILTSKFLWKNADYAFVLDPNGRRVRLRNKERPA